MKWRHGGEEEEGILWISARCILHIAPLFSPLSPFFSSNFYEYLQDVFCRLLTNVFFSCIFWSIFMNVCKMYCAHCSSSSFFSSNFYEYLQDVLCTLLLFFLLFLLFSRPTFMNICKMYCAQLFFSSAFFPTARSFNLKLVPLCCG